MHVLKIRAVAICSCICHILSYFAAKTGSQNKHIFLKIRYTKKINIQGGEISGVMEKCLGAS